MLVDSFSISMMVRDYELDMQGVVNNSVYQNYLEHARHEYIKSIGIDFADFARRGINLVIVRAELDYKYSLTSGDSFTVSVRMERVSAIRQAFVQEIVRADGKLVMQARFTTTALNERGRPCVPPEIDAILPMAAER